MVQNSWGTPGPNPLILGWPKSTDCGSVFLEKPMISMELVGPEGLQVIDYVVENT